MRTSTIALVSTAAALASAAGVLAQARPPSGTMSVDEIRVGMTGYGRTVFHGEIPETFPVEVVEVLHQARPGMDMVLVRPHHPILENAGTVAGMSGSPIYLNDRLIGAYAYGWEFGRETVSGVTPIANMLAELHRPRRTPPGLIPGSQVPLPVADSTADDHGSRAHARRSAWDVISARTLASRAPLNTEHGTLTPLAVPITVAGMSDGAFRYLSAGLEPMGLVPLQAGGAGRRNASPAPPTAARHFENGGSISVTLVEGDISVTATGTVTLADGDNVLAFGHPMMSLGEALLPATMSRVVWILSSYRRSQKMSEPVANLGALVADRPFGIVLDQHANAPMIPMHVRITGSPGAPHGEWNVRIANHRAVIARLFGSVIGSAIETATAEVADVAWVVHSSVVTHDHGTLEFTDYGASAEGTSALQMSSIASSEAVERLSDNPFEQVRIDRLDVQLEMRWAREFYFVRSIALSRAEVDPGETVQLTVSLGQYGAPAVTRVIPITIPREVAGRDVELEVGAGVDTIPDLAEPESIDDLIRNLRGSFPEDGLVISMRMPGQGVMLRGRVLPDLPASALDTLRPAVSTESGEPFLNVRRTVISVGRLVVGRDRVRIHVRDIRQ